MVLFLGTIPDIRVSLRVERFKKMSHGGAHHSPMKNSTPQATKDHHPSSRIMTTDDPIVAQMRRLVQSTPGTASLAQGIVYWSPPEQALEYVKKVMVDEEVLPTLHGYGADEGLAVLREALMEKMAGENGLEEYRVFVTHGAQQAFANVVIALLDQGDTSVLFAPYYFNHKMAIQMTVGVDSVVVGPPKDTQSMRPDVDWLEQYFRENTAPKMVVLVNPSNPTGVMMSKEELDRVSALCGQYGSWLVIDNTYEHFVYDDNTHYCPSGKHVLHIFSFSKAFGMMGWRQGYLAYHKDAPDNLEWMFLKVQDTVPICATLLSQYMSLGALEAGRPWVAERVKMLEDNRQEVLRAVSCLGKENIAPSEGAIYIFCRLPEDCKDDEKVVEWLVKKHKVCVIPGTSCGAPGYIRIAFGNLPFDACKQAAARLEVGLQELIQHGISSIAP